MKPTKRSLAATLLCIPACLALLAGVSADEDKEGGCILYGEGWAVMLSSPPGWAMTCHDPNTNGVEVALWPLKSTWKESPAVMYVNSAQTESGQSLRAFVDEAVARFKVGQPAVKVTEGPAVSTADGKPGMVRFFTGDEWENHEAVAYVDADAARLIFVLSARRQREFKRYQPALIALIANAHTMKAFIQGD